jgi:hypothetical protein
MSPGAPFSTPALRDTPPTAEQLMNYMLYLFPLSAAVSLVYSATRYEHPPRILSNAFRLFIKILIFMGIALAILAALSWQL